MKIDLHVHSSEVSPCGRLTYGETLELYRRKNYDGIVLSNHFSQKAFDHWQSGGGQGGFEGFNAFFFGVIKEAGRVAAPMGLKVFTGCELRFHENDNDYLIFGTSEEFFRRHSDVLDLGIGRFHEIASEEGLLCFQAHPFRDKIVVTDPEYLDGIETHNANPRHDSRNDVAAQWAKKFHLRGIAGSDCHRTEDVGRSGILTDQTVETDSDLLTVLRKNLYSLM